MLVKRLWFAGLFCVAFMVGLVITKFIKTTHGQSTAAAVGFMPMFGSSGTLMSNYSCVLVTGNSTTSGTFSFAFTASPLWVNPSGVWVDSITVISPGTSVTQTYDPFVTSLSSTSVSGMLKSGLTLTVLGATTTPATTAAALVVKVCGN